MANELTGIERQLVLQYLMDANVPVTVIEEKEEDTAENDPSKVRVRTVASGVFPVALPSEQLTVLDQGIILLHNPPESVKAFDGKKVRVQFYFNRLGLYFITTVKQVKSGLALVIPAVIKKIEEKEAKQKEDFTAILYYSADSRTSGVKCQFLEEYPLFVQPKWSDVEEENQQKAKEYLEKFVMECRSDGKAIGNGLFLISVVKFLSADVKKEAASIEGRKKSPSIIYIDPQRIVFACESEDLIVREGFDYSVVLGFPILSGPIKERTVYSNFVVEKIFFDDKNRKCCAVCSFSTMKEEDARYLEDKRTV